MREEVLELLAGLSRQRLVLVVTHEPELFEGLVSDGRSWRLERGVLQPLQRG